ncbi:MAG: aminotransferase class V-fold PLP-dependent enzyme [Myxococcales bacterium]|nr:aminotransferase class V-fold PLP-dependent enzyme [Myxococcales bacterium]
MDSPLRWPLTGDLTFLNHGSFGSCPEVVLEHQRALRDRFERSPITFVVEELEPALDAAREAVAAFVGADADDLVFVTNATEGVNTVLASLALSPGDELLTTSHAYNACANALRARAERSGAGVVVADLPFPLQDPAEVVDAIVSKCTSRTRALLVDHVTSPTGLVLPIAELVRTLEPRGVHVIVDGAHGPGMLPLDLTALGASFYTGNCHKWMCAPKGAAFLHVRRDLQPTVRPLVISHGANDPRTSRSRFQLEFGWCGTIDPSARLSVPAAIAAVGGSVAGGWPALMERGRALALAARDMLCDALSVAPPAPDSMIGTLASVPLPRSEEPWTGNPGAPDPLQHRLRAKHGIEIPIFGWPMFPDRVIRVSAAPYTTLNEVERLIDALRAEGLT